MNKLTLVASIGLTIFASSLQAGSAAVSQNSANVDEPLEKIELTADKYWSSVDRNTANYPLVAKNQRLAGCATVEYTLTPANEITNINVVSASNNYFAQAARSAINRWDLNAVKGQMSETNITTQTRFEFCPSDSDSAEACQKRTASQSYCKGEDVVAVLSSFLPSDATSDISIDRARNRSRDFLRR